MKTRTACSAILLIGFTLACHQAVADNLVIGTGGVVAIDYMYSDADYNNTLAITQPAASIVFKDRFIQPPKACGTLAMTQGLGGLRLLTQNETRRGCRIILDSDMNTPGAQPFPAGSTLAFNLCVDSDQDGQCDYVWSSSNQDNVDQCQHVRFTRLYETDQNLQGGEIWQMNWEDLNIKDFTGSCDPTFGDFNDLVAVIRVGQLDQDGDGLWDDWELHGIDTNGDAVPDHDLQVDANKNGIIDPGEKADYRHKDIFLEIDYMDCSLAGGDCISGDIHTHELKPAAQAALVQAFATAPVNNPDQVGGIALHIDVDQGLPHKASGAYGCGGSSADLRTIKSGSFAAARRYGFHYALFAHKDSLKPGASGCASTPGSDIVVTIGDLVGGDRDNDGSSDESGTVQQQAAVLMHELGHNLELLHGGDQRGAPGSAKGDANNKPNYVSIMNYAYNGGIRLLDPQGQPLDPDGAGPLEYALDYSNGKRPSLDESSLDEASGVGVAYRLIRHYCPSYAFTWSPGNLAINWDCDALQNEQGVATDINGDGICILPGTDGLQTTPVSDDEIVNPVGSLQYIVAGQDGLCQTSAVTGDFQEAPLNVDFQHTFLNDHNDWGNLRYDFQTSGGFTELGYLFTEQEELPVDDYFPAEILAPDDITVVSSEALTVLDIGTPIIGGATYPQPTVSNDAPAAFPFGTTIVTWTAVDERGNIAVDHQRVTVITLVEVDIKYGSDPNCIKTGSKGRIPLILIGSNLIDVTMIDTASIELDDDADRTTAGVMPVKSSLQDVNMDGLYDLVLLFRSSDLNAAELLQNGAALFVTGEREDHVPFQGSDIIYLAGESECLD